MCVYKSVVCGFKEILSRELFDKTDENLGSHIMTVKWSTLDSWLKAFITQYKVGVFLRKKVG